MRQSLRLALPRRKAITVPLVRRGVHICVEAMLNGKPALLALDTGRRGNALTQQAAKRLGLKPDQEQVDVNGAGEDKTAGFVTKISKLAIGEALLKAQIAIVIPLPDSLGMDGVLGTPFVGAWIVQIDYAHLRLTLTPRSKFQPPKDSTALPIRFYHGVPIVEATADGIKGWFSIDTGAYGAVTLFGPVVEQRHLRTKYTPSLSMVTGFGVGGLIYADLVRLPEFDLGPFHWTRVTTELSRQASGEFADKERTGNLGAEIWERFTPTLDYPDNKIYLTRSASYEKPFFGQRSGLVLDSYQKPALIREVLPAGPAAEAGIQVGDVVLAIDGTPLDRIKPWEVGDSFHGEPGKKIVLHVRSKDNTERDATLTLRDML